MLVNPIGLPCGSNSTSSACHALLVSTPNIPVCREIRKKIIWRSLLSGGLWMVQIHIAFCLLFDTQSISILVIAVLAAPRSSMYVKCD